MPVQLTQLPYAPDDLEPAVSARTLRIHHGEHHRAYVDKVNALTGDGALADAPLEDIIRSARARNDGILLAQAGQAWNHDFFWPSMAPGGGGGPGGRLAEMIRRDFGGPAEFANRFREAGVGHFASGWVWLAVKAGRLVVTTTHDGESLAARDDITPLITCDLWEHAYYLDYQNRRAEFLDAFLGKLIDWPFAEGNLERSRDRWAA